MPPLSSPVNSGRRSIRLRNSSSSKIWRSFSPSAFWAFRVSMSTRIGTLVSMVTSSRERNANSLFSSRRFRSAGLVTLSRLAYRFSREPNCRSSSSAVFSPTFGTPGILSLLSPINARKSGTCSGVKPYSFFNRSRSQISGSLPGRTLYILIRGESNCMKSLSPVTM